MLERAFCGVYVQVVEPGLQVALEALSGELHRLIDGQLAVKFGIPLPRSAVVAAYENRPEVGLLVRDLCEKAGELLLVHSSEQVSGAELLQVHLVPGGDENGREALLDRDLEGGSDDVLRNRAYAKHGRPSLRPLESGFEIFETYVQESFHVYCPFCSIHFPALL